MSEFKTYIIRIIIVVVAVQFGIIVTGEKFKKLYSLTGAIFIVFAIMSVPVTKLDNILFTFDNKFEVEDFSVAKDFTDNVAKKIEEDIMFVFKKMADVSVTTDSSYSNICITVKCECSDEERYRIEEYVRKTYCTSKDEVIMLK